MLKGRETEAREVLRKTVSKLGQEGIETELEDIRQTLNSGTKINIFQEFKVFLKWRNFKRYSCMVMACVTGLVIMPNVIRFAGKFLRALLGLPRLSVSPEEVGHIIIS